MIKLSYDLHIHSCLSPCGDMDMTPANIVGMAKLKNLDIIAVTDHNSCKNSFAVHKWAKAYGITAIPGMELCTREEVHVLCLFPELSEALRFDEFVYGKLMKFPNDVKVFGEQVIYDEEDHPAGTEPYLLINAADISFDELGKLMKQYHGLYIPAHLDKNSNSLLSNLGFIPPESDFTAAELADLSTLDRMRRQNPYLEKCKVITNSDAHFLDRINEAEHFLDCKSRSCPDIIEALSGGPKMERIT